MTTAISITKTSGFKTSEDICFTTKAPMNEPIIVKGNSLDTSGKFTFLDLIKDIVLVNEPIELANLLVAIAVEGDNPVNSKAGIDINPPPPTTESMKEAKKPEKTNKPNV
jgi:hypothetical protein